MIPEAQLTHVGVYVNDMDVMVDFYTGLFGLVVSDRGEFHGKHLTFLSRRPDEHHQIVLIAGRDAPRDVKLLGQISFRLADGDLDALRAFRARAADLGVAEIEGRNHGNSWSIYFVDPEGNTIEMYTATPWYVQQPWRVALDLDQTDDEIEAATRKLIEESATWEPVEAWTARQATRIEEAANQP